MMRCYTMQAVELVGDELLWDAPDICFTRKDHLRMASYIFKVHSVWPMGLLLPD
jgi:hypothetical protein